MEISDIIRCGMVDCIFCHTKQQLTIVGEYAYSMKDEFPVSNGHCLVIPKRHVESIFELSDDELKDLYVVLKQTKDKLENDYTPDGFNIGINYKEAGGQTIPHAHIHIIPRYNGDVKNPRGGVRGVIPNKQNY